jgi:hypothetical protein
MKLSTTSIDFTPAERAEYERRQREYEKLIARLAATETLEEQQRLADELCPRFDDWVRGRNRIQAVRRTRTRPVAARAPRRTSRPSRRPRAQATRSSAASGDSGVGDSDPEPPWLPGHSEVEEQATDWRPSLLVRIADGLRPRLWWL